MLACACNGRGVATTGVNAATSYRKGCRRCMRGQSIWSNDYHRLYLLWSKRLSTITHTQTHTVLCGRYLSEGVCVCVCVFLFCFFLSYLMYDLVFYIAPTTTAVTWVSPGGASFLFFATNVLFVLLPPALLSFLSRLNHCCRAPHGRLP